MLTVEPCPSTRDITHAVFGKADRIRDGEIRFVGSGKAAIRLIFGFLRHRGLLENKMATVLVPPWLGTWVYAALLPHAFPTLEGRGARVVLCYHQYGFPQKMDRVLDIARSRKIIIVEDCAHAFRSEFQGVPVGTFGEFSLYSFSKFVFCFILGGIAAKDPDFGPFVDGIIGRSSRILRVALNGFKLVDEANLHRSRPFAPHLMNGAREMAYARYPDQTGPSRRAVALWVSKRDREAMVRQQNYALLRRETERWGICDHLEADGVVPYAVPLSIPGDKAPAVVERLRDAGIDAGIRRFDHARCIFEPDYRLSVLVPIHSQMDGVGMDALLGVLKGLL